MTINIPKTKKINSLMYTWKMVNYATKIVYNVYNF